MNYMDVSRLVALLAVRTAAGISQIRDEQSALPPPERIAKDRPPTRNACTTTKTALLRKTSFSQQGANYSPRKSALVALVARPGRIRPPAAADRHGRERG